MQCSASHLKLQVLNALNEQTNKSHTICPYCFDNPPQQQIENANEGLRVRVLSLRYSIVAVGTSAGFRCFMCKHPQVFTRLSRLLASSLKLALRCIAVCSRQQPIKRRGGSTVSAVQTEWHGAANRQDRQWRQQTLRIVLQRLSSGVPGSGCLAAIP